VSFVAAVLKRPYTIAATVILVCAMGVGAVRRMAVDIFPEIDIPVVSVVWTYSGMNPRDMQDRILTLHERQLASLVDDISRIESTAYNGVGVLKVYLHEGADVTRAISQLSSSASTILKSMPRNITPPLVLRYGATDVPIIQLSVSSRTLPDTKLNDIGQNIIRPDLAVVRGASIPYPYGGMPRVMMVDIDPQALQARGLTPVDVSDALQKQNVILPSGDVKIADTDYSVVMNNSPDLVAKINQYPIKKVAGRIVFIGDVAHVHDGHQVQSNSVSVDGTPGALIMVRKTEGVSTLAVVDGVKEALDYIRKLVPANVKITPIFDQSVFVKAALNSVILGGLMAAGLTALMILLFLGNWRLTFIILTTIPLSIVSATLMMYLGGETLNTMTLGGFALAVGILVDNGTVVIENIERHVGLGEPLVDAVVKGAGEVGVPTMLSTLCICIVFVPIFLLQGTAKYLFSPLAVSVCLALIASLALSFTLVPVLSKYLMRATSGAHGHDASTAAAPRRFRPFSALHLGFQAAFERFRGAYRGGVSYAIYNGKSISAYFVLLMICSMALFPYLGRDFFPQVDAGQMRLHMRAPPATRIEDTQYDFAEVEKAIRQIVGDDQIEVVLDNIGLPYSGINIALSDSATVGPMDGEVLISLKKERTSTAAHTADLRRELPKRFPTLQFFFQPADIVDQVLNFGQPAPIDIRVTGPDNAKSFALASKIAADIKSVPGIVDSRVSQVPNAPALAIDVDRTLAQDAGVDQFAVANNVLVTTNSSTQAAPNFWVNPATGSSYRLIAQMPTYRLSSAKDLWTLPIMPAVGEASGQMLMNVARFARTEAPLAISQLNIRPVFDVNADVQGTDLAAAAAGIEKVLAADEPPSSDATRVALSGQVETMQESYAGLFSGMALAVGMVYLALVINFQSWVDPLWSSPPSPSPWAACCGCCICRKRISAFPL
jgi:multidrug efflux pump subunit AcrB